ncbi:MAG: tRNA (N6-isopentenyl adenosine(37)-C2)-methylthiotransferase MiaB [Erysipelotrichaceae bacterium]|nr:tRNA (N6-isopentenyl adenosine(37)-C2)-methylthiotransferase MiaB [Erysipelotrichaceae bacterium]
MSEFKLPNERDARVRSRAYRSEIVRDPVVLSEEQKILGNGLIYHVSTYGCQANVRDGEVICGILEEMGFTSTEDLAQADLIILNTCAIRENAENKVVGELGFLQAYKRRNPRLIVGVCGCMAQEEKMARKIVDRYPVVDLMFGTHNIYRLPALLENIIRNDQRSIEVLSEQGRIYEGLPTIRTSRHKAFVNIMDGCDKFCTYCIVPYTRGQQRSRLKDDVIRECRQLIDSGYREITLIGQNVNAYGKDLDEGYDFATLLNEVADLGIERLRFTTSHPWDFTDAMIDAIADRENIMPFIHLPLQSGNDEILKLMGRRYTREQYLALYDRIVSRVSEVAVSTDIIVGFPNETSQQFLDTLSVVDYCRYDNAYSFIYSPRESTPAARMADSTPMEEKKERLAILNQKLGEYSKMRNKAWENRVCDVLVDGFSKTDRTVMSGYTRQQKLVNFRSGKARVGDIIDVRITEGMKNSLNGIDISEERAENE